MYLFNSKLNWILLIVISVLVVYACEKNNNIQTEPEATNYLSSDLKNSINSFMPKEGDIAKVYKSFVKKHNDDAINREVIPDKSIDTLLWQTKTYLNTQYGFSLETAVKTGKTIDTISLLITGYTSEGVPIVDGQMANDFVSSIEANIVSENSDGNTEYIWCTFLEVDSVYSSTVTVIVTSVRSNDYSGVKPPGSPPTLFEHYTCMKAGGAGYCDDKWWWGANLEYENRIEMGGIHIGQDYILVLHSYMPVFPSTLGVNGRLWVGTYSMNYILDTDGTDELNGYLLSTKSVIDDYNPMGQNDIYLGNIDIYVVDYEPPPYNVFAYHYLVLWYFQKIYIEPIED